MVCVKTAFRCDDKLRRHLKLLIGHKFKKILRKTINIMSWRRDATPRINICLKKLFRK